MNQGYSTTVTPTVTSFNPFLPAIGRVYQVLCEAAPPGATIETNNRKLAEAAQCSPSAIPDVLRELEALDHIERITSSRGSLIIVLDRSDMDDRSFSASGFDQESDRSPEERPSDQESDRSNRVETPDRSNVRPCERSGMPDPPLHPPIWKDSLAAADSSAAFRHVPLGGAGGGAITLADHWPERADLAGRLVELGCDDPVVLDAILEAKPGLTRAQIEAQWQLALGREESGYTDNARALLFGTLRKPGGWLYGRTTSRVVDWSAYAVAADVSPPSDDHADESPPESLHACARRIMPENANGHDFVFLVGRLASGDSDDEALAALNVWRRRLR